MDKVFDHSNTSDNNNFYSGNNLDDFLINVTSSINNFINNFNNSIDDFNNDYNRSCNYCRSKLLSGLWYI